MKNILIFVVLLAFCSCTKEKELTKLNEPISDTVQCVVENIKSNPELWSEFNSSITSDSLLIGIAFSDTFISVDGEIIQNGFIEFYDIDCTVIINHTEEKLLSEVIEKYIYEPHNRKQLRDKAIKDSLNQIKLQDKLKIICNK